MKKFLLPLLALALTTATASAQQGPGPRRTPEEMATRQTEGLTRQLALSPDQSAKVQQIMLARTQEMQAMRGQVQAGGDRSQLREQMQANRAKYNDQLKAVLTPEQFTKFTALEAERMGGRGGRGGRGGQDAAAAPADATTPASLTDAKVKEKNGKVKIKAKSDK